MGLHRNERRHNVGWRSDECHGRTRRRFGLLRHSAFLFRYSFARGEHKPVAVDLN